LDPFHGVWQNAESSSFPYAQSFQHENLQDSVRVKYDEHLVPHVFAQKERDLYFVQGYLTAQFRLWQMEVQTHSAAGRLTEVIGEPVLAMDRRKRRLGMPWAARKALHQYKNDSTLYPVLRAYSKGVNAYIRSLNYADYPVEYKLLDYAPEDWTPLKTVLLLQHMSLLLAGDDTDLASTNALKFLGDSLFHHIYPRFPDTLDPIIPASNPGILMPTLRLLPRVINLLTICPVTKINR
jgi:penicillin amidase